MRRILIFGNAGSGKTTMARAFVARHGLAHLDLDLLAWDDRRRRPLAGSMAAIRAFIEAHAEWVIEGCYADLIEVAVPFCTEMRFLNPGVEACAANCRRRPWEPQKYATPREQDDALAYLVQWVREYETRSDEYSLRRHRAIFERFGGAKEEITSVGA